MFPLSSHLLLDKSFSWSHAFVYFFVFGLSAATTFFGFGVGFYRLYGDAFLENCYLHHGRRVDTQHNFSVFFYPFYLLEVVLEYPTWVAVLKHLSTLVQWSLVVLMAFLDLPRLTPVPLPGFRAVLPKEGEEEHSDNPPDSENEHLTGGPGGVAPAGAPASGAPAGTGSRKSGLQSGSKTLSTGSNEPRPSLRQRRKNRASDSGSAGVAESEPPESHWTAAVAESEQQRRDSQAHVPKEETPKERKWRKELEELQ